MSEFEEGEEDIYIFLPLIGGSFSQHCVISNPNSSGILSISYLSNDVYEITCQNSCLNDCEAFLDLGFSTIS